VAADKEEAETRWPTPAVLDGGGVVRAVLDGGGDVGKGRGSGRPAGGTPPRDPPNYERSCADSVSPGATDGSSARLPRRREEDGPFIWTNFQIDLNY
jgi:hypothetical protein